MKNGKTPFDVDEKLQDLALVILMKKWQDLPLVIFDEKYGKTYPL